MKHGGIIYLIITGNFGNGCTGTRMEKLEFDLKELKVIKALIRDYSFDGCTWSIDGVQLKKLEEKIDEYVSQRIALSKVS